MLQAEPALWRGRGLYVGCGNGRNYLPLVDAGAGARRHRPLPRGDHTAGPAPTGRGRSAVESVISAGSARRVRTPTSSPSRSSSTAMRRRAERGLRAGRRAPAAGRIALRARQLGRARRSITATRVVERDRLGGLTIRYDDGPKTGLLIHFASREDLLARAGAVVRGRAGAAGSRDAAGRAEDRDVGPVGGGVAAARSGRRSAGGQRRRRRLSGPDGHRGRRAARVVGQTLELGVRQIDEREDVPVGLGAREHRLAGAAARRRRAARRAATPWPRARSRPAAAS